MLIICSKGVGADIIRPWATDSRPPTNIIDWLVSFGSLLFTMKKIMIK